jgi:hypothetical protein
MLSINMKDDHEFLMQGYCLFWDLRYFCSFGVAFRYAKRSR